METAKGIVNSASKMVFGESQTQNETGGVEPVSGQTGEGTVDKPHDLGNTTGTCVLSKAKLTPLTRSLVQASRLTKKPQQLV